MVPDPLPPYPPPPPRFQFSYFAALRFYPPAPPKLWFALHCAVPNGARPLPSSYLPAPGAVHGSTLRCTSPYLGAADPHARPRPPSPILLCWALYARVHPAVHIATYLGAADPHFRHVEHAAVEPGGGGGGGGGGGHRAKPQPVSPPVAQGSGPLQPLAPFQRALHTSTVPTHSMALTQSPTRIPTRGTCQYHRHHPPTQPPPFHQYSTHLKKSTSSAPSRSHSLSSCTPPLLVPSSLVLPLSPPARPTTPHPHTLT